MVTPATSPGPLADLKVLELGQLIAGPFAALSASGLRGASNAKAKRELGWTLRYVTNWSIGSMTTWATYSRCVFV